MKKFISIISAILLASHLVSAQTLPDVKVEDISGETVSIRSVVKDKPAIISFWGVTCKPCIAELNALNDVMEDWLTQVDFDIIAVSVDDSRFLARAKSMTQGYGWQFHCVFDKNQDLKRAMNVSLTPQTFIVDKSGQIVYSHDVRYFPVSPDDVFSSSVFFSGAVSSFLYL